MTIILCVAGAGYVYNDWFVPGWTLVTVAELVFRVAVVNPLGDYSLHRPPRRLARRSRARE